MFLVLSPGDDDAPSFPACTFLNLYAVIALLFVCLVFAVCNTSNFLDFENSFILKLSQRIQLRSSAQLESSQGNSPQDDANYFHKTFPFFIWLLRDVVLSLPKDCPSIKDYFLTRVGYVTETDQGGKGGEGEFRGVWSNTQN